jgi:hypothetical protein
VRTITDTQSLVYSVDSKARASWAKVEVYSTITSAWVDLTSYLGYNWIRSVTIEEAIDNSLATAMVDVALLGGPNGELTSSPFVNSGLFSFSTGYVAYGALLAPHKQIRISLAVTPVDITPVSSDWVLKFRGRIAEPSIDGYSVRLHCRDEMGDLADAYIKAEKSYGDNGGTKDVEEVIQDVLNDHGGSVVLWSVNGTGGTPFNAGDSPGWATKQYNQQRQSVMDAIRVLADQIGYDLRFRWQTNAADLKLVLSAPDRSSPASLRTFTLAQCYAFKISLSELDIRNDVRVIYTDKAKVRQTYLATSATSITNYGDKFMEIAEESTSQIDTSTEAQALAERVLSDIGLPVAKITTTLPLFPNAELQDYYTFTGDDRIFSSMDLGVVSVSHTVDESGGRTTLICTSLPSSRSNWSNAQQKQTPKPIGPRNFMPMPSQSGRTANGNLSEWTGA